MSLQGFWKLMFPNIAGRKKMPAYKEKDNFCNLKLFLDFIIPITPRAYHSVIPETYHAPIL